MATAGNPIRRPARTLGRTASGRPAAPGAARDLRHGRLAGPGATRDLRHIPFTSLSAMRSFRYGQMTGIGATRGFRHALRTALRAMRGFRYALRTALRATRDFRYALRTALRAARDFRYALRTALRATRDFRYALRTALRAARSFRCALPGVILLCATAAAIAQAPIVQPGAPGEAVRQLTAEEAIEIAATSYSPDDVRFMQDMIPHHLQAVQMAELVADRTNREELIDAAGRIGLSQQDEIDFMQEWLDERGESLPNPANPANPHAMHTDHREAGMATPEQLAELATLEGTDFDRMFLRLMITHHEGAVTMVEALLDQPGSAYDPVLFEFANDVTNDQTAEIERMNALLVTLSDDPRAGLAAGFEDAGVARLNMELVAALPKPPGFYDPANPAGLPPERPREDGEEDADGGDAEDNEGGSGRADANRGAREGGRNGGDAAEGSAAHGAGADGASDADGGTAEDAGEADSGSIAESGADTGDAAEDGEDVRSAIADDNEDADDAGDADDGDGNAGGDGDTGDASAGDDGRNEAGDNETDDNEDADDAGAGDWKRSPLLSFSNTDMAFRDDILFAGSYHGFNIYRLAEGGAPRQLGSVVCPGGQGDVSVVGDLLIMSVEQARGRLDCGLQGIAEDVSDDRFRGLRIFNVSDLTRPVQVGAVQTCRGSHTHSIADDDDARIIVYNSGTSRIRDEEELPGCIDESPGDYRTALFRIDVIEIPVADPSRARIVHSPAVFADPEDGTLAGLWRGGDHGDETQETSRTDECHDITVFPELRIAAGACSGNGILFDISDPLNPQRMDAVVDKGFAYWHSATFNNDGDKVLFTDEWGGGSMPRCRAFDPLDWGADAIYDIVNDRLEFRSYFKLPAPQVEQENCVAHNGSVVPVPGRDIFVQAWYQGGLSVIDFSDSANPVEIAYFDRGPIHEDHRIVGGYWSAYWYRGRIYATEIVRGLDVLTLLPSEFLSANEIAAAGLARQGAAFNPQRQQRYRWPDEPVVARARLDQLVRDDAVTAAFAAELDAALDGAAMALEADASGAADAGGAAGAGSATETGGANGAALAARLETLAARLANGGGSGVGDGSDGAVGRGSGGARTTGGGGPSGGSRDSATPGTPAAGGRGQGGGAGDITGTGGTGATMLADDSASAARRAALASTLGGIAVRLVEPRR